MNDLASVLSRKCTAMSEAAGKATYPAVSEASLIVKRAVEVSRDSVTSGGRLRGVGKRGAKLGVRYDILKSTHVISLIRATGPWQLIERDTAEHDITPKGLRGRRSRSGKRALLTPDGPRAAAHSRGTTGKAPFAHGIEAGIPPAEAVLRGVLSTAVKEGFRA